MSMSDKLELVALCHPYDKLKLVGLAA